MKKGNKIAIQIFSHLFYIFLLLIIFTIVVALIEDLILPLLHINIFSYSGWKRNLGYFASIVITSLLVYLIKSKESKIINFLISNKVVKKVFPEAFRFASFPNTIMSILGILTSIAIQFFALFALNKLFEWLINTNSHILIPLAILFWVFIFVLLIRPFLGLFIFFLKRHKRTV